MEPIDLKAAVRLVGAEEAAKKAVELAKKINEAKTLAGELASLLEKLEMKIEL